MKKIIICLITGLFSIVIYGQKKPPHKKVVVKNNIAKKPSATALVVPITKIIMDEKVYIIKGQLFNTANYFNNNKLANKIESFFYKDKINLVITDVETDFQWNDGVKYIKTYTLPIVKIAKKDCYNIAMTDDAFESGKYERLTLLAATNKNEFKQSLLIKGDEKPTLTTTTNVTINIGNKEDAQKWLTLFIN